MPPKKNVKKAAAAKTEEAPKEDTTPVEAAEAEKKDEEAPKEADSADKKPEEEAEPEGPAKKKAKVVKHMTMAETAKEAKELLAGADIDADAKTRKQSKQIKDLTKEEKEQAEKDKIEASDSRRASLRKTRTMAGTAKVCL